LVGATGMRAHMTFDKTAHALARQRLLFRQGQVKRQISGHAALPRGSLSKNAGMLAQERPDLQVTIAQIPVYSGHPDAPPRHRAHGITPRTLCMARRGQSSMTVPP